MCIPYTARPGYPSPPETWCFWLAEDSPAVAGSSAQGLFLGAQPDEALVAKEDISSKSVCSQGTAVTEPSDRLMESLASSTGPSQCLTLKRAWHLIMSKPSEQGHATLSFLSSTFKSINNFSLLDSLIKKL